jgi:mRNA-degrading endonuclease RelE of RelBE toxin-antitoxin system
MYDIKFTPSALEDIGWFKKRERKIIVDGIADQLHRDPAGETRNRKRLRPNATSEWELRIEKYRIFYDLNHEERVVEVKVVGDKRGNRVVVRGEEYEL